MIGLGIVVVASARALKELGVLNIDVVITHAMFDSAAARAFAAAGVHSVRSTDSIPHPSNAIALSKVLADALTSEVRS